MLQHYAHRGLLAARAFRAVWVVCLCLLVPSDCVRGEPSPYNWRVEDTAQMVQALALANRGNASEAIRLALPLYHKAPHHREQLPLASIAVPGLFPLPDDLTDEWSVAQVLGCAFGREGKSNKCLALAAATVFREDGVPLRRDSATVANTALLMRRTKREFPPAVTINDLWVDFSPEPDLQKGCVFAPLAQLAPHLGFQAEVARGQTTVELRRKQPPLRLVFEEGKREVVAQGIGNVTLERAPMKHEGALMVPAAELTKLLDGEAHWYPEVRFMHLIIPQPKPKDEPAEQ